MYKDRVLDRGYWIKGRGGVGKGWWNEGVVEAGYCTDGAVVGCVKMEGVERMVQERPDGDRVLGKV